MNTTVRGITPQELIDRIADESIVEFAMGGSTGITSADSAEEIIRLVGKAWALPEEETEAAIGRISAAQDRIIKGDTSGKLELKLSSGPGIATPDGIGILQILHSLFETSTLLDERDERTTMLRLADYMADYMDLEEWIVDSKLSRQRAACYELDTTGITQ